MALSTAGFLLEGAWVGERPGYRDCVANFELLRFRAAWSVMQLISNRLRPLQIDTLKPASWSASLVKNVTGQAANMFIKKTSNVLRLLVQPYSIPTDFLATGRWTSAPGAMQATVPRFPPASPTSQANRSTNILSFRGPIQTRKLTCMVTSRSAQKKPMLPVIDNDLPHLP